MVDGLPHLVHEGRRSGLADEGIAVLAEVLDRLGEAEFLDAGPQLFGEFVRADPVGAEFCRLFGDVRFSFCHRQLSLRGVIYHDASSAPKL